VRSAPVEVGPEKGTVIKENNIKKKGDRSVNVKKKVVVTLGETNSGLTQIKNVSRKGKKRRGRKLAAQAGGECRNALVHAGHPLQARAKLTNGHSGLITIL